MVIKKKSLLNIIYDCTVPTQCTIKTMQTGAVVLEYVRLCWNSEKLSH